MLPKIEGVYIDKLPFINLRLVADLLYFEGPLLSYYKDNQEQPYLYYWCDTDQIDNRWLVFKPSKQMLSRFLTQQNTLCDLILTTDPNFVYMVDMDHDLQHKQIVKVVPTDLPESYLPESDTYYDVSLSLFHDAQATRDLIILMQQDAQATKIRLNVFEQAVRKNPQVFQEVTSLLAAA